MSQTAKIELGEPLLSDKHITRVADKLVLEFPELLDHQTEFVTWLQAPTELVDDKGLVTKLPEVAVFAVLTGHTLTKGAVYLQTYEKEDQTGDAALRIFRPVVREHLRILGNLEGVI